ncbi:Fur family transcriptional regulator [Paraburkholderia acidisoli]|uniref:Ferric uptake regulation protein n=1 Tax=Paraburkholderia acidisoli TaxID=2571748 RepID=A0A7Z2JI82_9BURK|nr:Fur family transcriptional regulator [Paraburkholderia acidisoli]QGZ65436.1 transcriptional repressor [Paraburkholderia acidisoli]
MRAIYSELKRAQMRPTSSRVVVLKLFHEYPHDHMTADQVFRRVPQGLEQCSLASVYRALGGLAQAGLLTSTSIGEQRVVYELGHGPHAHLVCETCGAIHDIHDAEMDARNAAIAAASGFNYASSSLVVFGQCAVCTHKPGSAAN